MSAPIGCQVSLAELISLALESRLAEVRVGMPATIETFDSATQLASVRPSLRDLAIDEEGNESAVDLPVISDVPCQFPGGDGFSITWPVKRGDPCWLMFSDRSLDRWLDSAGGTVDPVAVQSHHLTDAVAILGVRARPGAIPNFDAACMTAGKDGQAADFVALAQKVFAELDALRSEIVTLQSHQHTGTVNGAACTTTVTTPPPIPPPPVGSVASGTFKVKG